MLELFFLNSKLNIYIVIYLIKIKPTKLPAIITKDDKKKFRANLRFPCKYENTDLLIKLVAFTKRKVIVANLKVIATPAISAKLTNTASRPAKDAMMELTTKPDRPNKIKQILVINFINTSKIANFKAGNKENILPSLVSSVALSVTTSFFFKNKADKIVADKIIISKLGSNVTNQRPLSGPTKRKICKKLDIFASTAAPTK